MENLLSSLKVSEPGFQEALLTMLQSRDLAKDQVFDEGAEQGAWGFIEKGLIQKLLPVGNRWDVEDLLPEGHCMLFTEPAYYNSYGRIRLAAAEPSKLYYLSRSDNAALGMRFPTFGWNHFAMSMVAAENLRRRSEIWLAPAADRLTIVKEKYPFLLRAAPCVLADYLRLSGPEHTACLASFN